MSKGKVVTVRVAPKFLLGDAEMTFGLSGLAGEMPYWPLDSMMQMMAGPNAYRMKYRAALDNTTDWGPLTLRLEGVLGKDSAMSGAPVYGYYGEGRYALSDWLEGIVEYNGYQVSGQGSNRSLNAGLTFTPPNLSSLNLQVVYGMEWMQTAMMNERHWNVTTQLTFTF